jgi:uncharacterized protein (AIM24 family)
MLDCLCTASYTPYLLCLYFSQYVGLTPNFPGKIVPIEFGKHIDANHALYAQNGSYMTSLGDGIEVGCDYDNNCIICCCAGFGCCRQKIKGSQDDIAFIAAGGTLVYRKLEPDEVVVVDTRSIVAIEESVTLGIVSNGTFCMCCCGGEGCFSTTLTGPGKVFLQVCNSLYLILDILRRAISNSYFVLFDSIIEYVLC